MKRKQILSSNYRASRIDYVGAFIRLWVSFNTWYNDLSNCDSELSRVLAVAQSANIKSRYWAEMQALNVPSSNDNFKHIVDTVEDLSSRDVTDSLGNTHHHRTDTSGFRFRLICNRTNVHTDFLRSCKLDTTLRKWSEGLAFFRTDTRADPIFSSVYRNYKLNSDMKMWLSFDAITEIPNALAKIGISQFGSLLFHNLNDHFPRELEFVDVAGIFGRSFPQKLTRNNKVSSKTQAKRQFPASGAKGATYCWQEAKDLDVLERELLLLYKLRSSIVHGDRDTNNPDVQSLAKAGYLALDDLMQSAF